MSSMQTSDVTQERLQQLAAVQAPEGCRVLSLYLNLDPQANLAAPANRRSAVNSLLDEAHRAVEGEEELSHDGHAALREDVNRARAELDVNLDDGWAEGAHALALFLCGPGDLFEVLRLPRPLDNRVLIADRPAIEPLASEIGTAERWAVLLLDGDDARLLEALGDASRSPRPSRATCAAARRPAACPRSATSAASAWRSTSSCAARPRCCGSPTSAVRSCTSRSARPSACTPS
jgi:hypothetical protein